MAVVVVVVAVVVGVVWCVLYKSCRVLCTIPLVFHINYKLFLIFFSNSCPLNSYSAPTKIAAVIC